MKPIYKIGSLKFNDNEFEIGIIKTMLNKNNFKITTYDKFFYVTLFNNEFVIPKCSGLYNFPEILNTLLENEYIEKLNNHAFDYKISSRALLELI